MVAAKYGSKQEKSVVGMDQAPHTQVDQDVTIDSSVAEDQEDYSSQIWKDLEAESGFPTYATYLECYQDKYSYISRKLIEFVAAGQPEFWVREWVQRLSAEYPSETYSILDLLSQDTTSIQLGKLIQTTSPTQALQALKHAGPKVLLRIAIWEIESFKIMDSRSFDLFGLLLRLDPRFFLSVKDLERHPTQPTYVCIGTINATASMCKTDTNQSLPTVLLVFCRKHCERERSMYAERLGKIAATIDKDVSPTPPFHGDTTARPHWHHPDKSTQDMHPSLWLNAYHGLLAQTLGRYSMEHGDASSLIFTAFLPLFELDTIDLHELCRRARRDIQEFQRSEHERSLGLRVLHDLHRHIDNAIESERGFVRVVELQGGDAMLQSAFYLKVQKDFRGAIDEATRLKSDILNYRQLEVGDLALEKSKKSIELSNVQITEGKRGLYEWLNHRSAIC